MIRRDLDVGGLRPLLLAGLPAHIAVEIPLLSTPRTDPSVRDSRTGLPPWVVDGKPPFGPWMKDSDRREPVICKPRDSLPRHTALLAPPPQRATPEVDDVMSERTECPQVRWHRVVREVADDY